MHRLSFENPTPYQDFVAACRRYDRDALLALLSVLSRAWDGNSLDAQGRQLPQLPWNVVGVAATVLQRGSSGGRRPTIENAAYLSHMFSNLAHPGEPGDEDYAIRLIARFLYQQWPYQRARSTIASWARPVALFEQTSFKPGYAPERMTQGWAQALLGCSIGEWVSAGFCLHAAYMQGSRYPFIWDHGTEAVLELFGGQTRLDDIVHRGFATDLSTFRELRKRAVQDYGGTPGQQYVREPFAYNPLHTYPLVGGILDEYVAPCVPAIEMRTSALSIVYEGLAQWDKPFTHDAGHLFEQYVGRHLALIDGAELHPEISYFKGKAALKSIDWILVLPDVVVLVECKSMMPTRAINEGFADFIEAHSRLDTPIRQLNRTNAAILEHLPEFADIPSDRPVIGLIVTLGNFDMANSEEIRGRITQADIPTAVIGIDLLESLVMVDSLDLNRAWSAAIERPSQPGVLDTTVWDELTIAAENPILQQALSSIPITTLVNEGRLGAPPPSGKSSV